MNNIELENYSDKIHDYIYNNDLEGIKEEFKTGRLDPNIKGNKDRFNPQFINACIYNDDLKIIKEFIKNGVDVNMQHDNTTEIISPVYVALINLEFEIAKLLLDNGAIVPNKLKERLKPGGLIESFLLEYEANKSKEELKKEIKLVKKRNKRLM